VSEDAYDFYPCLVDKAPASIYVNLGYQDDRPAAANTRYWVEITMLETGPHGIGTADEAEVLNALEEAAIARVATLDLIYVGRIRHRGTWEMIFYGPEGHLGAIEEVANTAAPTRRVETGSRSDPDWSYYRELLLPDAERKQWMDDRRLVQIFREQGDRLTTPRRVDHWASFATAQERDAFVADATRSGFELEPAALDEGDPPFEAQLFRVDPIELDQIHDVVMILVDAATKHGGVYDGWETSIESG